MRILLFLSLAALAAAQTQPDNITTQTTGKRDVKENGRKRKNGSRESRDQKRQSRDERKNEKKFTRQIKNMQKSMVREYMTGVDLRPDKLDLLLHSWL